MGHHHHHHTHHSHASDGERGLGAAFVLNLGFTVIELIGGLLTNSIAILSDAVHDLGDSLSLGFAWWMSRKAKQQRDWRYSYGYQRFSLLGALLTSVVLLVGSTLVLAAAIPRLIDPVLPYAPGMLALALLGVAVNGAAVLRLRGNSSLNARTVGLHLMEDTLGWAAVLVVSLVLLVANIPILDPILSIAITLWILRGVFKNLRRVAHVFLQGVPEEIPLHKIEEHIRRLPGVCGVHHAHVWSLDGEHNVLSAHVLVAAQTSREEVRALKKRIRRLRRRFPIHHMTIEVEWGPGDCSLKEA